MTGMVVYTKVVADLFHFGHVQFFKAARAHGDQLVVHVVDDERVALAKRRPVMTQCERLEVVASCRYVDEVLTDGPKVITRDFMRTKGYHLYAYGYGSESERLVKQADCADLPTEMQCVIPYTEGISTTEIIRRIQTAFPGIADAPGDNDHASARPPSG